MFCKIKYNPAKEVCVMGNIVLSIWRPLSGVTKAKISAEGLVFEQGKKIDGTWRTVNPLVLSRVEVMALRDLIHAAELDGILK